MAFVSISKVRCAGQLGPLTNAHLEEQVDTRYKQRKRQQGEEQLVCSIR